MLPDSLDDSSLTGELPRDLKRGYLAARLIAEVADLLSTFSKSKAKLILQNAATTVENYSNTENVFFLKSLASLGNVRALLTANAQEFNCARGTPVIYADMVYPNAHYLCYAIFRRLQAKTEQFAYEIGIDPTVSEYRHEGIFSIFDSDFVIANLRRIHSFFRVPYVELSDRLVAELQLEVSHAAAMRRPISKRRRIRKGKPGRRGYPIEVLEYAAAIREANPDLKVHAIRQRCLTEFSEHDFPADDDSFRRWMNRHRSNRANRAK